ncbi:hypothetical protein AVEN_77682-1 [Araneus ventricosus]|uniref:Uncharacterized protein n=1 Tax=Araneus ventricosus TaxID=182803 RepID=A0A4Y2XBN9_ARAVE|nr:hypothetical protein AVEN_77682-1 [Araneus ventricosus]
MDQRGEETESAALLEHVLFGGGRTFKTDKGSSNNRFSNRFTRETEPLRGLKDKDGQRQTHRHMIVACEKESTFVDDLTYKVRISNNRAKLKVPIKNVHHLFRTMVYVSQPRASCDRGIPDDLEGDSMGHFHLLHSMSDHAIAFLCPMVPGGMEKLLEEQNQNKNVVDWEQNAVNRGRYKSWNVPIGITGFRFLNCVIPVDKRYEPTEEETDFCLYLHREKLLHFKMNPSLLILNVYLPVII